MLDDQPDRGRNSVDERGRGDQQGRGASVGVDLARLKAWTICARSLTSRDVVIADVNEEGAGRRVRRAVARTAGGSRLLGRVVRAVPPARAGVEAAVAQARRRRRVGEGGRRRESGLAANSGSGMPADRGVRDGRSSPVHRGDPPAQIERFTTCLYPRPPRAARPVTRRCARRWRWNRDTPCRRRAGLILLGRGNRGGARAARRLRRRLPGRGPGGAGGLAEANGTHPSRPSPRVEAWDEGDSRPRRALQEPGAARRRQRGT